MENIETVKFIVEIMLLIILGGIGVMIFIVIQKINLLLDTLMGLRESLIEKAQEIRDVRINTNSPVGRFVHDAQFIGSTALKAANLFINFFKHGRKKRSTQQ